MSKTSVTMYRRAIRRKNAGRKAKNARNNKGTTPVFPVHSADAVANAPLAELTPEQRAARQE
jgi:hypothetical protein